VGNPLFFLSGERISKEKAKPGDRWRLDETYIKVKGLWKYYYRAVDRDGNTIDFLLIGKRDKKAGKRDQKKPSVPVVNLV
jgi:putative transposase